MGIVALGEAAIATAPDRKVAETLRRALADFSTTDVTDPAALRDALSIDEMLGPATLAYCDAAGFRPADFGDVELVHAGPETLLAGVPAADVDESGLAEIISPAFVVRSGTHILAAAGYRIWPGDTAHISVLTAPAQRGRGLARAVASAAVDHALQSGLLPQWRARPEASRRVARALGLAELGSQLSIRLTAADDPRRARPDRHRRIVQNRAGQS